MTGPGFPLAAGLLLLTPATASAAVGEPSAVVFAVLRDRDRTAIEPVVILDGGALVAPPAGLSPPREAGVEPPGEAAREAAARFAARYYRSGRRYRLLFGGTRVGTVTVTEPIDLACGSLAARAQLSPAAGLPAGMLALATDSPVLGGRTLRRRQPTAAERARLLSLARGALRGRGLRPGLVKPHGATALDLRGRKPALVASFVAEIDTVTHMLFLVAEAPAGRYALTLLQHAVTPPEHETAYGHPDWQLVDGLDLDGDGQPELIARYHRNELTAYHVYRKQGGSWVEVYEGGGRGC